MDADLACKEANFPRGALAVLKNLNSNGLDFFMDEVECNGTETNLVRCKHKERSDCGADQAAGAICDSATEEDLAEEAGGFMGAGRGRGRQSKEQVLSNT